MSKSTKEAERQSNRDKFPEIAKFVDECRKVFGNVKVIKLEVKR